MNNTRNKIRVIFFGTPWIAKECLQALYALNNVEILAIVCQPDREKNRRKEIIFCETKTFALEHNIKVFQPEKIKDITIELKQLNPDIIITCAYGQFVNEEILSIPRYKCVNVHASLLPQLRGGAPIHWAIINRFKQTGITLMYMLKKMDAGDIIFQQAIPISDDETYASLLIKLAELAKQMLTIHFNDLLKENLKTIKQDEQAVSFAYNITKEEEFLDFNTNALNIDAKIRGLNNKPLAKIKYEDQILKVFASKISDIKSINEPGTIVSISPLGIEVATNDYNIYLTKIQLPNKSPVYIKDLINGNHHFKINTKFN